MIKRTHFLPKFLTMEDIYTEKLERILILVQNLDKVVEETYDKLKNKKKK